MNTNKCMIESKIPNDRGQSLSLQGIAQGKMGNIRKARPLIGDPYTIKHDLFAKMINYLYKNGR